MIGGKEVRINVRDRMINLMLVRIQHFKFDDGLSQLARRLRDYGSMSRIFWNTYQDRSQPKWNGNKIVVLNEGHANPPKIPSYINFGSYKHLLIVSYGLQMPTCRMCASLIRVLANCPKLANKVAFSSMNFMGLIGARTYNSVLINPTQPKPTTSGDKAQVNN